MNIEKSMSMILSRYFIPIDGSSISIGLSGFRSAWTIFALWSWLIPRDQHLRHQFALLPVHRGGTEPDPVENLRERVALVEEFEDLVKLPVVLEAAKKR